MADPTSVHASGVTADFFRGRCIAVTGAAGTIGRELTRQVLRLEPGEIRALDNDENGLFDLELTYRSDPRVVASFCDVAMLNRMERTFEGVDYVFHAAALKHVPICERTPLAAVDTNVVGVANIVETALVTGVKRVLFTSSDKAVNPSNVMGASKLMGERIAAAGNRRNGSTVISCTRFGNVAGSRGSVLPVFHSQIMAGGPVTLTAPEMSRFFMTTEQAVQLIIESMVHSQGGETFVTKMKTIGIRALARVMIQLLAPVAGRDPKDIGIEIIGPRMGEKLYEELVTDEEQSRTFEVGNYLIVQPVQLRNTNLATISYEHLGTAHRITKPYNSQTEIALTDQEIDAFLRDNRLFPNLAMTAQMAKAAE